jgi:hypothetical protein
MANIEEPMFNYAVGRYTDGASGHVSFYSYQNQIHYGTMEEAHRLLKYVQEKSDPDGWRIFRPVEVPLDPEWT